MKNNNTSNKISSKIKDIQIISFKPIMMVAPLEGLEEHKLKSSFNKINITLKVI